jgi:protein ImuA
MSDSLALDVLRRRIAGVDRDCVRGSWPAFTTGNADLDGALESGLAQGRLHELYAADRDDAASAMGFAAMLAMRVQAGSLAWLRTEAAERAMGQLYMPGLAEIGVDPGALILTVLPDDRMLLRAAADAAACPGLAAIVVECWGKAPLLTLTASRRLALAVEKSGVTLFLLRIDAEPAPSAAATRWRVSAAPSAMIAPDAPGHGTIEVELLRQRSGPAGMRWQMEWNRDDRAFRKPTLPGAVAAVAEHRAADANRRTARRSA